MSTVEQLDEAVRLSGGSAYGARFTDLAVRYGEVVVLSWTTRHAGSCRPCSTKRLPAARRCWSPRSRSPTPCGTRTEPCS
jgi:hypothetical protein